MQITDSTTRRLLLRIQGQLNKCAKLSNSCTPENLNKLARHYALLIKYWAELSREAATHAPDLVEHIHLSKALTQITQQTKPLAVDQLVREIEYVQPLLKNFIRGVRPLLGRRNQ